MIVRKLISNKEHDRAERAADFWYEFDPHEKRAVRVTRLSRQSPIMVVHHRVAHQSPMLDVVPSLVSTCMGGEDEEYHLSGSILGYDVADEHADEPLLFMCLLRYRRAEVDDETRYPYESYTTTYKELLEEMDRAKAWLAITRSILLVKEADYET